MRAFALKNSRATLAAQRFPAATSARRPSEHNAFAATGSARDLTALPAYAATSSPLLLRNKSAADEGVSTREKLSGAALMNGDDGPKAGAKCEEFPGGSTDCEVDEKTGNPTGKVVRTIDETNPCTRPCVQQHEDVHVKQHKKLCPQLRDCYLAADKGKRPVTECVAMAIFGQKQMECEAYQVSVPCMEKRLESAKDCRSKKNKEYGTRKLASERCFRDKNCS